MQALLLLLLWLCAVPAGSFVTRQSLGGLQSTGMFLPWVHTAVYVGRVRCLIRCHVHVSTASCDAIDIEN